MKFLENRANCWIIFFLECIFFYFYNLIVGGEVI